MKYLGPVLALFLVFSLPIAAESAGELSEGFGALEEVLPDEILGLLPDGFFDGDAQVRAKSVREASRFSYMLGVVGEAVGLCLGDAVALFASLLGILLIGALAERVRSFFEKLMPLYDYFNQFQV